MSEKQFAEKPVFPFRLPTKTPFSSIVFALLVFPMVMSNSLAAGDDRLEKLEERAFQQAASFASPSIVRIRTVGGFDVIGGRAAGTGATTGVIISEEGWIVSSAFNFSARPSSIIVELPDNRRLPAEYVSTDRSRKVTLLKIDSAGLVPATPSKKSDIRVGQWAIALGRTYRGPLPSVSVGIISAVDRIAGRALQTDAKVSPINYGGPLIDIQGHVMGILVPLSPGKTSEDAGVEWYDSGIGFAIPLSDVIVVLDRLKHGNDLLPGLMGIGFGKGVLGAEAVIDRVRSGSPAARAGLQVGDKIIAIDGKSIHRHEEVLLAMGSKYAGDRIAIELIRKEKTIQKEVELVAELVPYQSSYLGILPGRWVNDKESATGVVIRHVFQNSPAATISLQRGDVITEFHGTAILSSEHLSDQLTRILPEESVTLTYIRAGMSTQSEVRLGTVPDVIPETLSPEPYPQLPAENLQEGKSDRKEKAEKEEGIRRGRFTQEIPEHEHAFWAYIPEGYDARVSHGMMVWLHPNGATMEAGIFNDWKTVCDQRGIILLGPKSKTLKGWDAGEAEFVQAATEWMTKRYSIDSRRIFLHGYAEGASFAYLLAFKQRPLYCGVAAVAGPLASRPSENVPEHRLQFYLACGEEDAVFDRVQKLRSYSGNSNIRPVFFRRKP